MHFPTENLRSPAALARFLLTTVVGLALDLWTKSLAFSRLAAGVPTQFSDERGRMHWVVFSRDDLTADAVRKMLSHAPRP